MRPFLVDWMEEIKAKAAEANRLRSLEREAAAVDKLDRHRELVRRTKPLVEQIESLMASLPPALKERPWTMADLTSRLQGKYRDRPHGQMVSVALRQLGWRRVRMYGNYDGTRLWLPPGCSG
jgi:hypothetical protein